MTPAACENRQPGQGWVTRHTGLLAHWPSGCGTGSCLLFTDTEGSDLAGSVWPLWALTTQGSDLAGSCLALRPLTTLGLL